MSNQPQAHVADERAMLAIPRELIERVIARLSAAQIFPLSGELCRAALAASTQGADVAADIEFNAQRLRNVAQLVGLQGAIPDDDANLDGARGAVLGMIADRLRREMKWDAALAAGAPAETPKPDATGRTDADWNKETGTRLRRVAKLAGLSDGALPEDDIDLFKVAFSALGMIARVLEAAQPAETQKPIQRRATDAEITEWAERHNIANMLKSEARSAFEDVESLHQTYAARGA